jgi:hypothetical protein
MSQTKQADGFDLGRGYCDGIEGVLSSGERKDICGLGKLRFVSSSGGNSGKGGSRFQDLPGENQKRKLQNVKTKLETIIPPRLQRCSRDRPLYRELPILYFKCYIL